MNSWNFVTNVFEIRQVNYLVHWLKCARISRMYDVNVWTVELSSLEITSECQPLYDLLCSWMCNCV